MVSILTPVAKQSGCSRVRLEDINLFAAVVPAAVAATQSHITLYSSRDIDNCATCDPELAKARGLTGQINVPTVSLKDIMDELAAKGQERVDFLNIDIEGLDEAVLSDLPQWKFRPTVIMAEIYGESIAEVLKSETVAFLESEKYLFVQKVGHTCIFVSEEIG